MAKNYTKLMKDNKPKKYSLQKKNHTRAHQNQTMENPRQIGQLTSSRSIKRSITFKGAAVRVTVGLSTKNKETKKIIT